MAIKTGPKNWKEIIYSLIKLVFVKYLLLGLENKALI